jgi:transposase
MGRPPTDPELMIRMLIIRYVFAIRSERAICRDVQVNLAYRWFCGLSIEDKIPDHSAFSRARHERFRNSDMFRRVFERVVEACIAAGLVGGEGFAVDASLIAADANKQRSIPGSEWNKARDPHGASRAMALPIRSTGWSMRRRSRRTFQSSTNQSVRMGPSREKRRMFCSDDGACVRFGLNELHAQHCEDRSGVDPCCSAFFVSAPACRKALRRVLPVAPTLCSAQPVEPPQ